MKKSIYLLPLILCFTSCQLGRYVTKGKSDITDYKIFPFTEINTSNEKFHFESNTENDLLDSLRFNVKLKKETLKNISLESYLSNTKTTSFLIIRNDTIIFEK
ncbi:MAG: hypothetical protein ACPGVD_08030, partial [Flavobacteriales bacterium]